MNLFGIDIAGLVAQHIGPGVQSATLRKFTAGSYDANDPSAGLAQTPTDYPCQVIVDRGLTHDASELVRMSEGDITVILGTLPEGILPDMADQILVTPPGSLVQQTFVITGGPKNKQVEIDPAGATAVCHVKG